MIDHNGWYGHGGLGVVVVVGGDGLKKVEKKIKAREKKILPFDTVKH